MSIARSVFKCAVALLIAVLALMPRHADGQGQDGIDTSYLASDTIVVVVAYPQRIFLNDDAMLMPREFVSVAGIEEFGFDPLEVERVIAFAPMVTGPEVRFGIVAKFSTEPDIRSLKIPAVEEFELDGHTAIGPASGEFLIVKAGPNEVFVGDRATLSMMLAGDGGGSNVERLVSRAGAVDDFNVYLDFEPIKPMASEMLGFMPLPPQFSDVGKLPDLVNSVSLHAKVAGIGLKLRLRMEASSSNRAEDLAATLESLSRSGKDAMLESFASQMEGSDDPYEQAGLAYFERISESVLSMLEPSVDGNAVMIETTDELATTGIMVGLLLPAVQSAREAARRTSSMNNMRQLAIGMHVHLDAHDLEFPAPSITNEDGEPLLSWRVAILPYLGYEDLYEEFHLDEPWDSEHNLALLEQMPNVFANPNMTSSTHTNYFLPVGDSTMFPSETEGMKIADLRDGTSNTIMIVEANSDRAVPWTQPADLAYDPRRPLDGLGTLRANIFLAARADGSVQSMAVAIDQDVLRALMTPDGGEITP